MSVMESETRDESIKADKLIKYIQQDSNHKIENFSLEVKRLQGEVSRKSQQICILNDNLKKAIIKTGEVEDLKKMYFEKFKKIEKKMKDNSREFASLKDKEKSLTKENTYLRDNLKFKEKMLLTLSKDSKNNISKLESQLHIEKENNKMILDKLKSRKAKNQANKENKKLDNDSFFQNEKESTEESDIFLFG